MRRTCEELREAALDGGLSSKASLAWRKHARSCPCCRTELHILDTLQRQALDERHHLGRREVAALLRSAQEDRAVRHPLAAVWTWSLRLACLCLVFLVLAELRPGGGRSAHARADGAPAPGPTLAASALPAAKDSHALSPAERTASETMAWPVPPEDNGISKRLRELRRRIESRHGTLLELIERDLGDRSRLDVWDYTLSSESAAA